jgi:hypothetical protein
MSASGAETDRSNGGIELASEPGHPGGDDYRVTVQDKDRECFVGDAVPLASDGVKGGAFEPEAGVVLKLPAASYRESSIFRVDCLS